MKSKESSIENTYLMGPQTISNKNNKNKWNNKYNLLPSPSDLPKINLSRSPSITPNLNKRKFSEFNSNEIQGININKTNKSENKDFFNKIQRNNSSTNSVKSVNSNSKIFCKENNFNYEGDLVNNEPHGKGNLIYNNGDTYFGDFLKGKKSGNGVEKFLRENLEIIAKGQYENGMLNGKGILKILEKENPNENNSKNNNLNNPNNNEINNNNNNNNPNSIIYKGEFRDNKKEGFGILETLGQIYLGQFLSNEKDGVCMIYTSNKSVFRGQMKNGKKHGFGSYQYTNGSSFEGEFNNGEKCGVGIAHYANGDNYIGCFRNGMREGLGFYENKNGWSYNGEFMNGKSNGRGLIQYKSGDIYEGEFLNGKKHGFGIYYFSFGDVYVGEFDNNNFEGFGEYTNYNYKEYKEKEINNKDFSKKDPKDNKDANDTRIYKGFFKEGKKHGKGFYYNPRKKEGKFFVEYLKGKRIFFEENNNNDLKKENKANLNIDKTEGSISDNLNLM